MNRILTFLRRHARPWISKLEPKGPTSYGIQFEFEWPDAARTLSKAERHLSNPSPKTQSKND